MGLAAFALAVDTHGVRDQQHDMRAFLRKCRGAIGIGVTWAVAWGAIFAALGVIVGIFDPDSIDPGEDPVRIGRIGAIFGFVSGVAFHVSKDQLLHRGRTRTNADTAKRLTTVITAFVAVVRVSSR